MEIRSANDYSGVQERVNDPKTASREPTHSELQQEQSFSKEDVNKEIGHLNKWLESKNSHLHFVLYDKLNEYYVQVVNDKTNEVIKEIPSKKIMDMIANFQEKLGLIVDKKV